MKSPLEGLLTEQSFPACLVANLPGQELEGQLQVVFQGPELLHVTAEADVAEEEPRTEFL